MSGIVNIFSVHLNPVRIGRLGLSKAERARQKTAAAVEEVKGEKWKEFRDRHGDWGRDAALYFGRRQGRMKLGELAKAAGGMDYAIVGSAISRFAKRVAKRELREVVKDIRTQFSKNEI